MIRAHDESAVLTIDVEGPATMLESPAVRETATERLSSGPCALRIDLRDCTMMDSTFSGTLLSLKRQLDKVGGTLTLVSPSPKVVELLQQMGLENFYPVDVSERVDGTWSDILVSSTNVERLKRMIVDAHDELARVPGPSADTFRTVVEELRRSDEGPEFP
jgi:anti-anti-sigma factor